jgi:nitrite reductase (NADH) small subunit
MTILDQPAVTGALPPCTPEGRSAAAGGGDNLRGRGATPPDLSERPLALAQHAPICPVGRLTPDRGVAAIVDGRQVAVFLLSAGTIHAVDNVDPCSGAAVLSRGIVGDAEGVATVASPLYKQRFDLHTGLCLDADVAALAVHDVAVVDGVVHVALAGG